MRHYMNISQVIVVIKEGGRKEEDVLFSSHTRSVVPWISNIPILIISFSGLKLKSPFFLLHSFLHSFSSASFSAPQLLSYLYRRVGILGVACSPEDVDGNRASRSRAGVEALSPYPHSHSSHISLLGSSPAAREDPGKMKDEPATSFIGSLPSPTLVLVLEIVALLLAPAFGVSCRYSVQAMRTSSGVRLRLRGEGSRGCGFVALREKMETYWRIRTLHRIDEVFECTTWQRKQPGGAEKQRILAHDLRGSAHI